MTLHDEGKIRLDPFAGWDWDISEIGRMQVTDNVVELLADRVLKFDDDVIELMKVCSCLGMEFDLETVSEITGRSIYDLLSVIAVAIREGMITIFENKYRFLHNEIREAVYSLIPDETKLEIHYSIGRCVLTRSHGESLSDDLFFIVFYRKNRN